MQQQAEPGGDGAVFGFLTAVDSPLHGLFGGYLVVDALGRPLEFHCTAPVKVSRAQQILYGPTLHGHLHGQQIGGALLAESKATPAVVLTDHDAMLHVRPHTSLPLALVRQLDGEPVAQAVRLLLHAGTRSLVAAAAFPGVPWGIPSIGHRRRSLEHPFPATAADAAIGWGRVVGGMGKP